MPRIPSESDLIKFSPAERLSRLPAYIFVRLDELKAQARANGTDLIDLGLGNPDQPTPQAIVEALRSSACDGSLHGYPPFDGRSDFKQAIAGWMLRQHGVKVDSEKEVLPLPGSKEGLAHLALAYVNDGDSVLVPTPSYPVHLRGPVLAGGQVHNLPLTLDSGFLPDLAAIPDQVATRSKMLFLNYPNNPTGATAPASFLEEAVAFCKMHGILLVHDLAYGELYFGAERPPSLLEFPGAKDVGVEFHTLSKTFNMAGWRLGFVVGNEHVIKTLYAMKTNIDYGVFGALQKAAIAALELPEPEIEKIRNTYRQRRDLLVDGLRNIGFTLNSPQATMYLWLPLPPTLGMSSTEFAERLLAETGVVVTPGVAFGPGGEGFVRISMVAPPARLQEAIKRWKSSPLAP